MRVIFGVVAFLSLALQSAATGWSTGSSKAFVLGSRNKVRLKRYRIIYLVAGFKTLCKLCWEHRLLRTNLSCSLIFPYLVPTNF